MGRQELGQVLGAQEKTRADTGFLEKVTYPRLEPSF